MIVNWPGDFWDSALGLLAPLILVHSSMQLIHRNFLKVYWENSTRSLYAVWARSMGIIAYGIALLLAAKLGSEWQAGSEKAVGAAGLVFIAGGIFVLFRLPKLVGKPTLSYSEKTRIALLACTAVISAILTYLVWIHPLILDATSGGASS